MAMLLDPRTKSVLGIPGADYDVIWQYITEDAIELAMSLGPIGPTQPVLPQAQTMHHDGKHICNCINYGGVGSRYTHIVNQIFGELDYIHDTNESQFMMTLRNLMMQYTWMFNMNMRVKNGTILLQLY